MRTEPPGSVALASHCANAAARSRASRSSVASATSRKGCGAVRASSIRSAAPIRAGRRPLRAGSSAPGNRVRTAASASASSISASSGPGAGPGAVLARTVAPVITARQAGGIAAASSLACRASTADSTGRQRAAYPPSSAMSAGSTRPREARSPANRTMAARYPIDPLATTSPGGSSASADSSGAAATGSKTSTGTRQPASAACGRAAGRRYLRPAGGRAQVRRAGRRPPTAAAA